MADDQPKLTDAELNEWMALKMGWSLNPSGIYNPNVSLPDAGEEYYFWEREGDEERDGDDCPDYCKDGNLMLEVMDWLFDVARACDVEVQTWQTDKKLSRWRLTARSGHEDLHSLPEKSADLPRALCELCYEAHGKGWLKEPSDG